MRNLIVIVFFRGNLEARVTGPRGETETIDIVPIEEGESYAMRFVPKEVRSYFLLFD